MHVSSLSVVRSLSLSLSLPHPLLPVSLSPPLFSRKLSPVFSSLSLSLFLCACDPYSERVGESVQPHGHTLVQQGLVGSGPQRRKHIGRRLNLLGGV